jgi:hypothetical protein
MGTRPLPSSRRVPSAAVPLPRARRPGESFEAAERFDLEGIVAKRKADSYRPETVWYKIKSRTYTQGERGRTSVGALPEEMRGPAAVPAAVPIAFHRTTQKIVLTPLDKNLVGASPGSHPAAAWVCACVTGQT